MSDSENELYNPNVFTFQNGNTTVSARGPYTNISNFSFRNQLTSTMYNMPRNFERQRYAESVSDQRSIYYRRERSPMSIQSAYNVRPHNFPPHYNGMGSQQSIYNGRSGSPLSVRSIDSSASVSAADIAFAFKNVKFNKFDLKVIKEAYQKLMKQRHRKRVEKRRNMRLFLKNSRNRSGDNSGDQASDSSISSDDCRSVKTSYNDNNMFSNRMTRMDSMVKDCSDNFRQNTFKNIFSIPATNSYLPKENMNSTTTSNNLAMPSLKERFQSGFVLPSQRFSKTVASTATIGKMNGTSNACCNKQSERNVKNRSSVSGSEDEIFSRTVRENTVNYKDANKRTLDSDEDTCIPNRKKSKKSSPTIKSNQNLSTAKKNLTNKNISNAYNFEFAKPTLPVRKTRSKPQEIVIAKAKPPEIVISQSKPPEIVLSQSKPPDIVRFQSKPPEIVISKSKQTIDAVKANAHENLEIVEQVKPVNSPEKPHMAQSELYHDDVSMRPSFIKRKLFTQKLDVAEKANASTDAINSPQNVYSSIQKEKNKARKLVPTQSCMNREIQGESNLLDLIHKIVPPDSFHKTNQTKTNIEVNNSNKRDEDDDRWDVTPVISMCNEKDVSDTFTDEEIFDGNDTKKDKNTNDKEKSIKLRPRTRNSSIIKQKPVDKIDANINTNSIGKVNKKNNNTNKKPAKTKKLNSSKQMRSVDKNMNSPSELKKVNNKTNKENNIKPVNPTKRPTTRNSSKIKDNPKSSITENKNASCTYCIVTNKADKEKNKKTNTNPYHLTRSSSFIKPKAAKSLDDTINTTQGEDKIMKLNNTFRRPTTRSSSSSMIKSFDESMNSPRECRTNNMDKNKSKNNITTPSRVTRNSSHIKLTPKSSKDETVVCNVDKGKCKKNNGHLPARKNNKTKTKDLTYKNDKENVNVAQKFIVLLNKLPDNQNVPEKEHIQKNNPVFKTNINMNIVQRSARTFWDTDFESDAECQQTTQQRRFIK